MAKYGKNGVQRCTKVCENRSCTLRNYMIVFVLSCLVYECTRKFFMYEIMNKALFVGVTLT